MIIKIVSEFDFNEDIYDKAFGLAKSLIVKNEVSGIRKLEGFVITAKRKEDSVLVKIIKR